MVMTFLFGPDVILRFSIFSRSLDSPCGRVRDDAESALMRLSSVLPAYCTHTVCLSNKTVQRHLSYLQCCTENDLNTGSHHKIASETQRIALLAGSSSVSLSFILVWGDAGLLSLVR